MFELVFLLEDILRAKFLQLFRLNPNGFFSKKINPQNISKILQNFEYKILRGSLKLKIMHKHGLTIDEPLVYEDIIKDCFANPHRKKGQKFFKTNHILGHYPYNLNQDPEYWINLIDPPLRTKFNSTKVRLYQTDHFREKTYSNQEINKAEYISGLKKSSWCGPFRWD